MLPMMPEPLPRRSSIPLISLAIAKLALHLVTMRGYGFFRDEFYYLASTEHLDWGYVEHPPLSIAMLAVVRALLGDSIFAVRVLPAIAGAATVIVAGLIVRELGGSRRAEWVAALAVVLMPTYLGMHHFYSMNAFDVLFWALLSWLAIRAMQDRPRTWIPFGFVAGLGLMNKLSVGFFGFALLVGLLATKQRAQFRQPALWVGGLVALLILAPHLAWQMQNDWPTLEFQANAREFKNVSLSIPAFATEQFLFANPIALPLWLAGGIGLFVLPRFAAVRAVALVYPVLFALFATQSGKPYYLTPIYTLLFAAGAVALDGVFAWSRWVTPVVSVVVLVASVAILPLALPVLTPEALVDYTRTLGVAPAPMEKAEQSALPQNFADMHGWSELIETVERVAESLPAHERAGAIVLATNYGEAGAIDFFGPARGLPDVFAGHNSYWHWRPDHLDRTIITLRRTREELEPWFESIERVDTVKCQWCMPFQNDAPVHVVRGLKVPFEEFWAAIKRYI